MTLLPIPNIQSSDEKNKTKTITEFNPSPEEVFSMLVPKYIAGMIYCTIVDSFASEQASRRSAMENATNNYYLLTIIYKEVFILICKI